ncbi:hypothetical protein ACOMHN_059207 [Nucella lapillus]
MADELSRTRTRAGYFIPVRPEVVLVRDVTNHSVTLTWSRPDTPSHIVYVVQEKEENHWAEAHLVMGADHFTRHKLDVCSRPTYRVAAVSRYGSYWFSEQITTPDMSPDPPGNLHVKTIEHNPDISSFSITLSWFNPPACESVEALYSGPYCTPPPFNPPGNVKNVHITVFPGVHGARAHVTWWPPSDLGSAGVIGFYRVFYGFIKDTYGFMTFRDNFYQNITLPGGLRETDIPIAQGSSSGDKFGILVMAGAPGQAIEHPIGFMNQVHATMSDGRVLLDEDIVVYQLEDTREVRVYWNAPSPGLNSTGVALQWGPVNRRHADVISDVQKDDVTGLVTHNGTAFDVELSVWNTTVLKEVGVYYESAASHKSLVAVSAAVGVLVVAAVLGVALGLWCRRWRRRQKLGHLYRPPQPELRPYSYFLPSEGNEPTHEQQQQNQQGQDDWEVPHSALKVGRVLGAGAFGQVLLGRVSRAVLRHGGLPPKYRPARGGDTSPLMVPVAIKMLKEGCEESGRQEFLREMSLMKEVGAHRHVVSMLGCCTLRAPYCLLVEHMAKGDLLNHLKTLRNNISVAQSKEEGDHYENHEAEHVSPMDLLSIARQIVLGMDFLADKGYVHRDLAARNVLIGEGNEVKVGDFGLARYVYTDRVYVNRKGGKLPLKWMAMESIFDLTFSTASDVWSFGVVLFEIVTLGGTPYPTLPIRGLLRALKEGYRMERPDNCSEEM